MKLLRMVGLAVVAILMSVNLSSCKDDDKDDKIDNCDYIVGTWVRSNQWVTIDITFKENGKGTQKCTERGYDPYTFKFTYKMVSETEGYLTQYAIEEDGEERKLEELEDFNSSESYSYNLKIEDGDLYIWHSNSKFSNADRYTRK